MWRMWTTVLLSLLYVIGDASVSWAEDCQSSGSVSADCDGDGYTPNDGDCDDFNSEISPERSEDCDTTDDDDCDGYPNAGCPNVIARGSLRGGSACEASSGTAAWVFLLLPGFAGFRRRSTVGAV